MDKKTWAGAFALAVVAIGAATAWRLAAAAREAASLPVPALVASAPGGDHPIGRTWIALRDASRNNRDVGAWIWYPASTASGPAERALPAAWADAYRPMLAREVGEAGATALLQVRWHARADAPFADGRHPLLLFAHGANQLPTNYNAIVEPLVARGYIVVGVVTPGVAAVARRADGSFVDRGRPDAAQIASIADDLVFARSALMAHAPTAVHIDAARIGAFGHSMGGAAAVLAATRDPAIRASANLDGDYMGDSETMALRGPVLYLTSREDESEPRRAALWERMAGDHPDAVRVRMSDMAHANFQDAALLPPASMPENRRARFGTVDGATGLRRTADRLDVFFSTSLRSTSPPRTSAPSARPSPSPRPSRP